MKEIKLYKTPWKALRLMALTIPFVAAGIWTVTKDNSSYQNNFIGWGSIIFFGLGFPLGLFNLFDRRPQIIINESGIWDRTTNQDEVKWEQIKSINPVNISGQKFISLTVDDSFVFKTKEYKWATKLRDEFGLQQLNLNFAQVKIDDEKLLNFINAMLIAKPGNREALIVNYLGL